MKSFELFLIIMIFSPLLLVASGKINFDHYFIDKTMRIDYFHIGDATTEIVTIDRIYQQGIWAGSLNNLIDNFDNGTYYIKIYDAVSGVLIYSKGFDSYFKEYQLSGYAAEGIKRTYHESAIIPFPKAKIKFSLEKRDKMNKLNEVFSILIDPGDVMVIRDEVNDASVKVIKSHYSGDPHKKVDIAILGEGYSTEDEDKFNKDLERFTKVFFKLEPYKNLKDKFNIYGVFKPSVDSGVDEPRAGIFKNTVLNATFNSLGSERYLLTEDNKSMRDLAAHVPYDAIYIMVNHNRYGGGGIYNFFCTFTSDNQFAEYLFTHEFGHSFSGLADEYYTSSTAYNDFYPEGVEPVEPNITRLLDPQNVKWKDLLTPSIEVPTPWEKEKYDETDYAWQKVRREMNNRTAELKRNNAPADEIKDAEEAYAKRDKEQSDWVTKYLADSKFAGMVGAFEGAGYSANGVYRPMTNCLMFSRQAPFCKVCQAAIAKVINHYTE
ncbi:M64 family metallopeptidase [Bacteroidota bacterium]